MKRNYFDATNYVPNPMDQIVYYANAVASPGEGAELGKIVDTWQNPAGLSLNN